MKTRSIVTAVVAAISIAIGLTLLNLPLVPGIAAGLIAALCADFLLFFVQPWRNQRALLIRITASLNEQFADVSGPAQHIVDLKPVEAAFSEDEDLSHVWGEFEDTLHEEHDLDRRTSERRVVRYRQTAPAEAYFSQRALIDGPLSTDYFRHLPGILTGLGIVGTFSGLIVGLGGFKLSDTPARVNSSVDGLLHSVREAFYVSGVAIAAAMVVTWIEKIAVSRLHGHLQELQQAVDQMFDAGAGEAYLERIAAESAESAAQMKALRQGLVDDLAPLLEELGDRQVAASHAGADAMREAIIDTFQEPLATMTAAIEKTQEEQQAGVQRLLEGTLEEFAKRLEKLVGEKLTGAAESIEAAAEKLRATLDDVPRQLEEVVTRIRTALAEIAAAVEPITGQAEQLNVATASLAGTVESAAETLDYALGRFKTLGDEMDHSVSASAQVASSLGETARQAEAGAQAIETSAHQLEGATSALDSAIVAMRDTITSQQSDRDSHRQLAESVERAARELKEAQDLFDGFVAGISNVMAESHGEFAQRVSDTLASTHEEFHKNLANATGYLANTVNEFDEFLSGPFRGSVDGLSTELQKLSPKTER